MLATAISHSAPTDTANPLDSILTPWGSAAREVTDACTMSFDGERLPISVAMTFGWLRKDGDSYVVTGRHVAELAQLRGSK